MPPAQSFPQRERTHGRRLQLLVVTPRQQLEVGGVEERARVGRALAAGASSTHMNT
jgi:hypothetical protein